eukprot:4471527-Pleurochrysis_carterae.AAC.1
MAEPKQRVARALSRNLDACIIADSSRRLVMVRVDKMLMPNIQEKVRLYQNAKACAVSSETQFTGAERPQHRSVGGFRSLTSSNGARERTTASLKAISYSIGEAQTDNR